MVKTRSAAEMEGQDSVMTDNTFNNSEDKEASMGEGSKKQRLQEAPSRMKLDGLTFNNRKDEEAWQGFAESLGDLDQQQKLEIVRMLHGDYSVESEQSDWKDRDLDSKVLLMIGGWRGKLSIQRESSEKKELFENISRNVVTEDAVRDLLRALEGDGKLPSTGRSDLTCGITDLHLKHDYDLVAFQKRVNEVLLWHSEKEKWGKYVAPYFVMVQSSGMGKTKLLHEYKELVTNDKTLEDGLCCKIILCLGSMDQDKDSEVFDANLSFEDVKKGAASDVYDKLDNVVGKLTKGHHVEKLVLCFDEAQGLMIGDDSFVFRAVRWWLRIDRKFSIVAVFTGTTSRLTNFFPPEKPGVQNSRDDKTNYKNYVNDAVDGDKQDAHKILYDPFFRLHTIGCLSKDSINGDDTSGSADASVITGGNDTAVVSLKTAVYYGRPLFAYYEHSGQLKDKLFSISKRLVLSKKNEFKTYGPACLSVLGSRVQMGAVPEFKVVEELVSAGYACLLDFKKTGKMDSFKLYSQTPTALISFMPDPLCAAIAMTLMREDGRIEGPGPNSEELTGLSKRNWAKIAKEAFESGICLPEKGPVGEVFSALYLLFCGDLLREKSSKQSVLKSETRFEVSLLDWLKLVMGGGKIVDEGPSNCKPSKETGNNSAASLKISFLQFCRNHFRSDCFCDQDGLRLMYNAGLGSYTYSNCKAVDKVCAIKNGEKYHPLLVSDKNWKTASASNVNIWMNSMKEFVRGIRDSQKSYGNKDGETGEKKVGKKAGEQEGKKDDKRDGKKADENDGKEQSTVLCLLVLLGCSKCPEGVDSYLERSLGNFPDQDEYRLVYVEDDEFDISKAILELGQATEQSSIYASHGFLFGESEPEKMLLSGSRFIKDTEKLLDAVKGVGKT